MRIRSIKWKLNKASFYDFEYAWIALHFAKGKVVAIDNMKVEYEKWEITWND